MGASEYVQGLRAVIGHSLLLLPAVTAIPTRADGCVLLGRNAETGLWGAVGGSIEPAESPRDALSREVQEELGVQVDGFLIVGSYGGPDHQTTYPNGDVVAYVTTAYIVQLQSDDFTFSDGELSEARWFSKEQLADLDLPSWFQSVLTDVAALPSPSDG